MDELLLIFDLDPTGASRVIWTCMTCGEENEAMWDPTGGDRQEYVEDCTVCCRPNVLTFTCDHDSSTGYVRIRPE